MKKKIFSTVIATVMALVLAVPVYAETEPENIIIAEEETAENVAETAGLIATNADSDYLGIDDEKGALHISYDSDLVVTEVTHHGKPLIIQDDTNRSTSEVDLVYFAKYKYWNIADEITGGFDGQIGQNDVRAVIAAARNYERENGMSEEEVQKLIVLETKVALYGKNKYSGSACYGFKDDMIVCAGDHYNGEYRNDPDKPLPEETDPEYIQKALDEIVVHGKTTAKKIKMTIYCSMPNTGIEYTIRVKAPNSSKYKEYKATKTGEDKATNVSIKTKLTGKFKIQVQASYVYDGVTYTGRLRKYKVTKTK